MIGAVVPPSQTFIRPIRTRPKCHSRHQCGMCQSLCLGLHSYYLVRNRDANATGRTGTVLPASICFRKRNRLDCLSNDRIQTSREMTSFQINTVSSYRLWDKCSDGPTDRRHLATRWRVAEPFLRQGGYRLETRGDQGDCKPGEEDQLLYRMSARMMEHVSPSERRSAMLVDLNGLSLAPHIQLTTS